jgi:hypothetical protein
MTVGSWYTLGSDVQLLRFGYETHLANQLLEMLAMWVIQCVDAFYRRWAAVNIDPHVGVATKTKGNEDDGSYECHPKDPFESAEGHREFKILCWIEWDRAENENVRRPTADPNAAHSRNSRVVQIVGIPLITDRA